jgi:sucrose-6-phosphate hydrolase SacC (GH32 family)
MKTVKILWICLLFPSIIAAQETLQPVGTETLAQWSSPYRGWTYYPDAVIPSDYKIPGAKDFHNYDVPCVYQLEGLPDIWYMSFIGFNGKGYNSFVAESADLVHWTNPRLAMGFGPKGEFDNGGSVIGGYLYESWDVAAPRVLKKKDGKYLTLYGCYPRQGGYELRPGYEGVAESSDGIHWKRASDQPILSIYQSDCMSWEKDCIYQPWLVEHEGTYYNFYNAANGGLEQSGLALSNDLIHWVRYPFNPVVGIRADAYDEKFASDPKVFRDNDHWTMIYFGVGKGGASIMIAFSRDLLHWTADPEPLYKFGGHPTGLDQQFAHKISLVFNPKNNTFYMFYCAVGNKGRTIGLLTKRITN